MGRLDRAGLADVAPVTIHRNGGQNRWTWAQVPPCTPYQLLGLELIYTHTGPARVLRMVSEGGRRRSTWWPEAYPTIRRRPCAIFSTDS